MIPAPIAYHLVGTERNSPERRTDRIPRIDSIGGNLEPLGR